MGEALESLSEVRRCFLGDKAAREAFVRRHQEKLLAHLVWRGVDHASAADALQDAFLAAMDEFDKLPSVAFAAQSTGRVSALQAPDRHGECPAVPASERSRLLCAAADNSAEGAEVRVARWLKVVAWRKALDHRRKHRRLSPLQADGEIEDARGYGFDEPPFKVLKVCRRVLTARQQRVVGLRAAGHSLSIIASALHISDTTVKSEVSRARARLAKEFPRKNRRTRRKVKK